ncbi:CCS family citrate carrier protein [Weissella beninensis]|uniref:2-hydroxycarboxylate transporter family protein n=1 Tax=Periweissella beninensis TaxID=504936 RepID=A0ABT0VKV2_9LACO|nr:2-hydroxycarboxylate transporter family protein [Periweissella beninensis]MBM7544565.1 CCS family citrate carrier protein [Periweissella beninensis]MCM2438064.1 2-hydroxycarboxylate transporter family protein [Periweissella beninensis]
MNQGDKPVAENKLYKNKILATKISGISLPMYLIMLAVLIIIMAMHKLPNNILGAVLVLTLLGHLFYFIGEKLPIFNSYLGGGSVFCIFASAALATFGVIPADTVDITKNFINNMGFLDFYIAALITGAILGMNRNLLLKASVRFIPVALLSMIITFFAVGLVGMLLGNGFGHSVMYVSLPIMAGGIGAGVVPLSSIYGHALGQSSAAMISQLIPASALGNVMAIISAAMVAKVGKDTKYDGHAILMEIDPKYSKTRQVEPDIMQMGVGMLMALTFFMIGTILNSLVPKVHTYAFIIIVVILCKAFNLLPQYYEDAAIMFNQLIVKNLTHAVLAGIGIALLNLSLLASALTWQFVVLCLTSIITISLASAFIGKMFGLFPVESVITAGLCNNSMGGTGNVAVLSASNRMGLIAFAQMGNRLGGAIVLVIAGILIQFLH